MITVTPKGKSGCQDATANNAHLFQEDAKDFEIYFMEQNNER